MGWSGRVHVPVVTTGPHRQQLGAHLCVEMGAGGKGVLGEGGGPPGCSLKHGPWSPLEPLNSVKLIVQGRFDGLYHWLFLQSCLLNLCSLRHV